jgi:large subunit ribosomal protein L17
MLRNLASSLFLTYRDATLDDNPPAVQGRVVTTHVKAKEVRGLVEKCVTLARKVYLAEDEADKFGTSADRNTAEWRTWRNSANWKKWAVAMAPAVAGRRRLLRMLRDKRAVRVLCSVVAPKFLDHNGGYTRILRLARPRLGDAGARAILEMVGKHDRAKSRKGEAPAIADAPAASGKGK